MLERVQELPEGVDGIRARGEITKQDYENVVAPLLDAARREGRRIRLLYQFGPEFERFTAAGAWEDVRIGIQYLRLFERCAIVSDVGWIRDASQLVGTMMPCPVRIFGNHEWQEALDWLGKSAEGSRLSHRLLSEEGVLILEPEGALRSEDIEAIAMTVDPWIEAHGALRGVVVHARAFPGWENLSSFLRHLRFLRDYQRKVGRVALAADGKLAALTPKLAEHFVSAEVKHFAFTDLEAAVAWAAAERS